LTETAHSSGKTNSRHEARHCDAIKATDDQDAEAGIPKIFSNLSARRAPGNKSRKDEEEKDDDQYQQSAYLHPLLHDVPDSDRVQLSIRSTIA
jgi:hypothetical protein